ncbi:MAG: hypothetical protein ACLQJR_22735 [Stellaceae bacterium]
MTRWLGLLAALVALAGCAGTGGARDVDYTPERGISADIAASHTGPGALDRGETFTGEPIGAIPWTADERH